MINNKLIDVFLQNAEKEDLIRGMKEIFNHFKLESEYRYEELVNNIINIIGGDTLVTIKDIDINLIKDNIDDIIYKPEEIDKDSIEISNIDNINNTVKILYKRKNEDYKNNSIAEYTNYLKKVKEN